MTTEERLQRLERQCRWYHHLFVLVVLGLVAFFSFGTVDSIPNIVRAKRFEVTDKDGNVVARLGHYHRGSGYLEILTREGAVVIEASALRGNGLLKVYRENGEVILTTERSGS